MLACSSILLAAHLALASAPRAAILSLDDGEQVPAQQAAIEASLAVRGYSSIDSVDARRLLGDEPPEQDAQALAIEAKKAFGDFDSTTARERLRQAQDILFESPRILSERTLLADLHLLEGQIALSAGQHDEALQALARAALLEPDRTLHPGLYPPDLIESYTEAQDWLKTQAQGALVVTTWPEHAHVYVDGVFRGEAPAVIEGLPAGWHYATAAVDGRGARTRPFLVEGGRSTQTTLFVPDEAVREQLPSLLRRYRAQPDDADVAARLLTAVGAQLLVATGTSHDAAAQILDDDQAAVVVEPVLASTIAIEARVDKLLEALRKKRPASLPGVGTTATSDSPPASLDPSGDGAPSPWPWIAAGAAGLVLAGGVTAAIAIAIALGQPEEPEDRVDIYLGGPSL
ncbi:MAG: PEGA domain-containing protein [Pseudomonadota bacterium]